MLHDAGGLGSHRASDRINRSWLENRCGFCINFRRIDLSKRRIKCGCPACIALLERRGISILFLMLATVLVASVGYTVLERGQPLGFTRTRPTAPPVVVLPTTQPLNHIMSVFQRNQTIASALSQHGFSATEIHQLVEATHPVYNLAKINAGRSYWLYFTPQGEFHDFRYVVDEERYLTVYREGAGYVPVMKRFGFETRVSPVSGTIDECLFLSVKQSGEQEQLALDIADIFSGDLDFYTDIKKGDTFRVLIEKKYLDGRFVKYGPILAASLTNEGKVHVGYRYQDGNGSPSYYTAEGQSLRKAFLKSPLKFGRITSRFSGARLHPILKIVRPHLGVDYAAPTGTPVIAVGSGTVELAARSEGSGKMVKLRHPLGFESMYLHLSRIAVRAGQRIDQGEILGYVGSTGLATGPHLDFRVLQHGRFINPTKMIVPPNPPLPRTSLARFASVRDTLQKQLQQAGF